MKTKIVMLLINILFRGALSIAQADECLENIHFFLPLKTPPKITGPGDIEKKIEKFYMFSRKDNKPSRSVSRDHVYGLYSIDSYYAHRVSYKVEIHSFVENTESVGLPLGDGFYQDYAKQVEDNIDYVLSIYQKRRDWSPEFLEEVKKQAKRDADRTQYIVVKKMADFKKDEDIWGTLKIVRSRENNAYEELLPTEEALGIKLPFNNGFKYEPGNFTVDKDHYKDSMAQLILHLSRIVKKEMQEHPQINPTEDLFYTYADRESKLMYTSLGFHSTKGFEQPFKKEGKDWWVLSINGEDLGNLPLNLKKSRSAWSEHDQEVFEEVTSLFDSMPEGPIIDRSLQTNDIQSSLAKKPSFVAMTQSESHLYRGEEVQKLGIVFDHFGDDGAWNMPLLTKELPLIEGKALSTGSQYMSMVYRERKIIFDYAILDDVVHYELAIDPYLKKPTHLFFQKKRDDLLQISFEANFSGSL